MALRTVFNVPVGERTTVRYTGQLVDETGANIAKASVATLTLSIINSDTDAIVNNVSRVNILDTGRGTLGTTGLVTITLEPADNQMADQTHQFEKHILYIEWTYGTNGTKAGNHEVEFPVYNRGLLPIVTP